MKYVMFLMALMFFKVAAGLCIYFIASTFWGLAERRFLPKAAVANGNSDEDDVASRLRPNPIAPLPPSARPFAARKRREARSSLTPST